MATVLIDLFSGIGGMAGGLMDAGFEFTHHYFSEIDKHAIAVYKYKFPHAEYIGAVENVSGRKIRRRHPKDKILITFGWPCQDNSIAGKRKGQRIGSRSGLLFEAGRIVIESKCESFIAENVKGLSSVNGGYDIYEAIRFLTYFNTGHPQYVLECQLLNTAWILPQNRERFYFVGHIGKRCERRIFPLTENDFGINERTSETTNVRTLTGGQFRRDAQFNDAVACVRDKGQNMAIKNLNKKTRDQRVLGTDGECYNLISGHYNVPKILCNEKNKPNHKHGGKERVYTDAAPTLQERMGTGGDNIPSVNRIRRLTETECERLQGFEDGWTQYGNYDGEIKKVSKTQRYKQMGNAVTKKMVQIIGSKLLLNF